MQNKTENQVELLKTANKEEVHKELRIIEVWEDNLDYELGQLNKYLEKYNIASIDTEYPGIPWQVFLKKNKKDLYQEISHNTNRLNLIQLGISLCDDEGNVPDYATTWQFNFNFDLTFFNFLFIQFPSRKEKYAYLSIKFLDSCGINFEKLIEKGINYEKFATEFKKSSQIQFDIQNFILVITSNEKIIWVIFNGGFDLAFLTRLLSNSTLPNNIYSFYLKLSTYFKTFFDIKYAANQLINHYFGLTDLAKKLNVAIVNSQHQAGSNSFLTQEVFKQFKKQYLSDSDIIFKEYQNVIFGLGHKFNLKKIKEIEYINNKSCSSQKASQTSVQVKRKYKNLRQKYSMPTKQQSAMEQYLILKEYNKLLENNKQIFFAWRDLVVLLLIAQLSWFIIFQAHIISHMDN